MLAKQHSGFYVTRLQNARYAGDAAIENCCPNCHCRNGRAGHLCVYQDENRTQLLQETMEDFEQWLLRDNSTYSEIAYWVPKYILFRGTIQFEDIGIMSHQMIQLARSQDKIGCMNFTEGRISHHFYEIHNYYLSFSPSFLNGGNWMRQFIPRILRITHSQWIHRNFTLHHHQRGYICMKDIRSID